MSEYKTYQSQSKTYLKSIFADAEYLFGGSIWEDTSIRVYDKETMELVKILEGPQGTIFCLVADDSFLFSGAGDSKVVLWNKEDWSVFDTISGQQHFILSLAIDERYIYCGGIDDCTNIFARDGLDQVASLRGHESNVLSLSTDEKYLYSGSGELWWGGPGSPRPPEFESSVRVWNKKDWSCIKVLQGHVDNVNAIANDSKYVYSISDDATLRVFSKNDWSEVFVVKVPARRIDVLTMDDNAVFLGCADGSIRKLLKSQIQS